MTATQERVCRLMRERHGYYPLMLWNEISGNRSLCLFGEDDDTARFAVVVNHRTSKVQIFKITK